MIFVTVGTQEPFDRLLRTLDQIAPALKGEEIIAQTGAGASYTPQHITTIEKLTTDKFDAFINRARIVVAHAGMGTIITTLTKGKALIVFPRIAALGEHRNEHQLATAQQFSSLNMVQVATNADELLAALSAPAPTATISDQISPTLRNDLAEFLR